MKDFYFGEISIEKKLLHKDFSIGLNDFIEAIKVGTNRVQLTQQLNRLLLSTNNQLVIKDGTSHPQFNNLLKNIEPSEIHAIEIERRNDINQNVKATLACNIFFKNGVLNIRPEWCGYKPNRAEEIISTLLIAILFNGLIEKLTFNFDGEIEEFPDDSYTAIALLFSLSSFREQEDFDTYVANLDKAKSIVAMGKLGQSAFDQYDKN